MKRLKFYVCPTCKNALLGTGEAELSCCGRRLKPLTLQQESASHEITVNEIEDDLYVTIQHEMTKKHFISFVAYVSFDRVLFIKLYPEQAAEVRFPKTHSGDVYFYCNQHGLMKVSSTQFNS